MDDIETILLEFFSDLPGASVQSLAPGLARVRFEPARQELIRGFGGRESIDLAFDSATADEDPRRILVTSGHPFLETMRNLLISGSDANPRLSEIHFPVFPTAPGGDMRVPGVSVSDGRAELEPAVQVEYETWVIVGFEIAYDSDVPAREIVHLTLGADGKEIAPEVMASLQDQPIAAGRPAQAASTQDLAAILRAGREVILKRVKTDVQALGAELGALAEQESQRVEEDHRLALVEINARDPRNQAARDEAKGLRERRLADIQAKFRATGRVCPISLTRVWIPRLNYVHTVRSREGTSAGVAFHYDFLTGSTKGLSCKKCSQAKQWRVCGAGTHLACCVCHATASACTTCSDSYCGEHGRPCRRCQDPTCHAHGKACSFDSHGADRFCARCVVSAFDGRAICEACRTPCVRCERQFPKTSVTPCDVCGTGVCHGEHKPSDGEVCSECGRIVCRHHGAHATDEAWVCERDVVTSHCCAKPWGRAKVVGCADNEEEQVCPVHRKTCAGCTHFVCPTHARALVGATERYSCGKCVAGCPQCPPERFYLRAETSVCVRCAKHTCGDHRKTCKICQKNVYCSNHESELPRCGSCGLLSCKSGACRTDAGPCGSCGVSYCQGCVGTKGGGSCHACKGLKETTLTDFHVGLWAKPPGGDAALLADMELMRTDPKRVIVRTGETETHRVFEFTYRPAWWKLFSRSCTLLLVTDQAGKAIRLREVKR